MDVLPACMYMHHVYVKYTQRSKELITFTGTAGMGICEPPQCPLNDHPVLLPTESSLQPQNDISDAEIGTCVLTVLSGIYFRKKKTEWNSW